MPRALKTGKCKLILYANAAEVIVSKDGKSVTGVRYFDARTRKSYEVKAKKIVLACGPIESARLLLLSKSNQTPHGLANSSGLVGKNLITHTSSSVQGYLKSMLGRDVNKLENDDGTESDDNEQLATLLEDLRAESESELGQPVRVFTIAYGEDADLDVLREIAEATNAAAYDASDPASITKVFTAVISNF